jgi:electron transfer flavoprotein alpha subunit
MAEIFTLIEHRQGVIRDISFELLACARQLASATGTKVTAVVLGEHPEKITSELKTQAHRILVSDHQVFKEFNAESYQLALAGIIKQEKPFLTLIGHTACGMDLAPALATQLDLPFTTDCLNVEILDRRIKVIRQMYDGKLNARILLSPSDSYLVTLRSGSFPGQSAGLSAAVQPIDAGVNIEPDYRRFIEYIEAAAGAVDITKADVVVGIGRGIKEQANIALVEEFAKAINGVLACSRPIIDAGWLPKERQVGSSGKTVKPKLYIALGISGAFQHIAGMKGSETIIAVNKDPNAPIFNEADYGIVDDLFKVVPTLKNKILEIKK